VFVAKIELPVMSDKIGFCRFSHIYTLQFTYLDPSLLPLMQTVTYKKLIKRHTLCYIITSYATVSCNIVYCRLPNMTSIKF